MPGHNIIWIYECLKWLENSSVTRIFVKWRETLNFKQFKQYTVTYTHTHIVTQTHIQRRTEANVHKVQPESKQFQIMQQSQPWIADLASEIWGIGVNCLQERLSKARSTPKPIQTAITRRGLIISFIRNQQATRARYPLSEVRRARAPDKDGGIGYPRCRARMNGRGVL